MSIKIGVNPIAWTNDDMPELGRDTTLEQCLQEGKKAGYSGFELGSKFPRQADVLRPILQKHDLDLVSGWFSGQLLNRSLDDEIKSIDPHLQLLKTLSSKVMVYCEVSSCIHGRRDVPLSQRPVMNEKQWQEWTENLNALAKYTLSQGVQLAYHHHMGTVIQTQEEVEKLMKMTTPDLGLLLDTGHLLFSGGEPLTIYKKYSERINHIHCKDIRKDILHKALNEDLSFLDAVLNGVFTVPGDGCIDYKSLFEQIYQTNYQGWVVVEAEQDPDIAHPLTYAEMGYNNIKQYCQSSGIKIK